MARVTVEDCIMVVPNRFELVLLAAQRARDISAGLTLTVSRDNDKNPVIALREIAEQSINLEELRRHIARGVNRHEDLNIEDDALLALAQEGFGDAFGGDDIEISEVSFDDGSEDDDEVEDSEADLSFDGDDDFVGDDLDLAADLGEDDLSELAKNAS